MPSTTHSPANSAAWLPGRLADLAVKDAPYTPPGDDQIVVRGHAVAVNPLDWIIQVAGDLSYRWLSYPTVLGSDVAGEVVQVGKDVTRFTVGDRVIGHAVGTDKDTNRASEGTFQRYSVVLERMACPIPGSLSFEQASVLPLALSTAACGLFQQDHLGLQHPSAGPTPTGETVLVWGGSTSAGSNAIQLAVAAGYEVITTASPRNFEFVKDLGASEAFDYNSPSVTADIISAFRGRRLAGAIAFGTTAAASCVKIVASCEGNRFVSIATPPVSFDGLARTAGRRVETLRTVRRLIASNVALQVRSRTRGVRIKYIWGTSLKNNEVSHAIYRDFLPAALAEGRYRAAPEPRVIGHGLQHLQRALDIQREGVSAQKIVITIPQSEDH
jgi:NADPH:quinone reductase-like Zn-dependent oxidoreductase